MSKLLRGKAFDLKKPLAETLDAVQTVCGQNGLVLMDPDGTISHENGCGADCYYTTPSKDDVHLVICPECKVVAVIEEVPN